MQISNVSWMKYFHKIFYHFQSGYTQHLDFFGILEVAPSRSLSSYFTPSYVERAYGATRSYECERVITPRHQNKCGGQKPPARAAINPGLTQGVAVSVESSPSAKTNLFKLVRPSTTMTTSWHDSARPFVVADTGPRGSRRRAETSQG